MEDLILELLGSFLIIDANAIDLIICKVYLTVKFTLHLIFLALRRLLLRKEQLFQAILASLAGWCLAAQKQ